MSDDNLGGGYKINFGNKTDVGCVREKNEDYIEYFKSSFGDVFVLCDGMGGHIGGEIASRLAVSTIKDIIINNPGNISNTVDIIYKAILEANKSVYEKSSESNLKGMGTTVVVLIISDGVAFYAHVGDSRLYIIRNGKIFQLTRDHSFVQNLIDSGVLSYDDAENHPRKNEITKALGINDSVAASLNETGLKLFKNDKFIICSDGLSSMISDEHICSLAKDNDPVTASELLVSAAKDAGGRDNVSVHVVSVVHGPDLSSGHQDSVPVCAIIKHKSTGKNTEKDENEGIKKDLITPDKKGGKSKILILAVSTSVFLLAVITVVLIFNPFGLYKYSSGKTDYPETGTSISSNKTLTAERTEYCLLMILKNLYEGSAIDNGIEYEANSPEYIDSGNNSKETFRDYKTLKAALIKKGFLVAGNMAELVFSRNDSVCTYKVSDKEGNNVKLYSLAFSVMDGNKFRLHRIHWVKDVTTESTVTRVEKRGNEKGKKENKDQNNSGQPTRKVEKKNESEQEDKKPGSNQKVQKNEKSETSNGK